MAIKKRFNRALLTWLLAGGLSLLWTSGDFAATAETFSHSPVNGSLSSDFGWRKDPYSGKSRFHAGVDIAASSGTPIYSPQSGTVVYSGPYNGYGNVVVIKHPGDVYTLYGHTARYFVQAGQPVYAGQAIAQVGSTGRSTGPHLHFEVRQNQGYVNPKDYLSYLEQVDQPSNSFGSGRITQMGVQNGQAVGGPEVPVSYTPPAYTAHRIHSKRIQRQIQGNATQAQQYTSKPGRTMQVISGTQVKVVQF